MACEVTILIPHYQTKDMIKLCLRCIRRFTRHPYRVVVIDNGSRDESLNYLEKVPWITLLKQGTENHLWHSHWQALNTAIAGVTTPYSLLFHSDTIPIRDGWLAFLVTELEHGPYAAAGSRHQRIWPNSIESRAGWLVPRAIWARERGIPEPRSFCTLYSTALLKETGQKFVTHAGEDVNEAVNKNLQNQGKPLLAIPSYILGRYVCHMSCMTSVVNRIMAQEEVSLAERVRANLGFVTDRMQRKSTRMHNRLMRVPGIVNVLSDASLDT